MTKSTISYALIAVALFGSVSAVAFAQQDNGGQPPQGGPGIQAGIGDDHLDPFVEYGGKDRIVASE